MNGFLVGYALLVHGLRVVLFVAAVIVAVIALVDWLVRTRRISPFNGIARFFRRSVDPLMVPVERTVMRAGGQPASAPWWSLVAVIVGGVVLISLLDFVGGLLLQLAAGISNPRALPIILLSWAFKIVELALIVRVLSSWLPISPYSRWIRWTNPLTNWILVPLRRVIPLLGMIDITPIVAYLLLAWILEPTVLRLVGAAVGA
ncbi:MAG TPA: YggT family protein [Gemmatimonadaceae bacterium]|jgi:YggT family protein|nr:YggT family protein [Gemmatimonadaceae bacterium]